MLPTYHNRLYGLFSFKLADASRTTAFAISPDGTRLAAATERGSISVYDTRLGHHQVQVDLLSEEGAAWTDDSSKVETKLVWTSDSQLIFSGNGGHLYYATLTHGAMHKPPIVCVSYGFQYHTGRVTFLAYDTATCILVVAYDYLVTIWRSAPGDRAFQLFDRIEAKQSGVSQLISPLTVQFIRGTSQQIFIAGPFGCILWSGPGLVYTRWAGPGLAAFGASAVSPRTGDIVITTFNHEILRWRLSGGIVDNITPQGAPGYYKFDDLQPDTAPAITSNDITLIARENHLAMMCPGGEILQQVRLPDNYLPRGIQAYGDRIYLALDGLAGEVIYMALTTNKGSQLELEGHKCNLNLKPESLTEGSSLEVDLNEISTVMIKRANTSPCQIIQDDGEYTRPGPETLSETLVFSTFYAGLGDVSTIVRIAFTPVPDTSSMGGKVVFLAHSDIENAIARRLAADEEFMSKLVVQLLQWMRRLE